MMTHWRTPRETTDGERMARLVVRQHRAGSSIISSCLWTLRHLGTETSSVMVVKQHQANTAGILLNVAKQG